MSFASSPELRAEVLTACRVLTHFRIVEGFGHVSARIAGAERILITPRKALGGAGAVILRAKGMLAVGQSIEHACVRALFLEETGELQLLAAAAGLTPRFYSAEDAARRHGDDRVHEPLRAWEYYVAMAEGRIRTANV